MILLSIEDVGRIAHEINRAYCQAIGDPILKPWASAPDWQKSSVMQGVTFHMAHPEAGPEASHEAWLEVKRAEGWKYGAFKDEENKLHPNFVPFNELSLAQQVKDYLFRAVVHALLMKGGE